MEELESVSTKFKTVLSPILKSLSLESQDNNSGGNGMFGKNVFNNVVINGKTITCSGSNIVVANGEVIVDGKVIESGIGSNPKVIVNGNVNVLSCHGSVEVHGNSGDIDCGGSCTVKGNVSGNVDAGGSVTCGNVSGDVDAGGSIRMRR